MNDMGASHKYRYVNTSGMIKPSGSKSITVNGTYDVTNNASAIVNVPGYTDCKPFITYKGSNYNSNKYRHFTVPDNYISVYCIINYSTNTFTHLFYLNGTQISATKIESIAFANSNLYIYTYKLQDLNKGNIIGMQVMAAAQYIQFYGISTGQGATSLELTGDDYIGYV